VIRDKDEGGVKDQGVTVTAQLRVGRAGYRTGQRDADGDRLPGHREVDGLKGSRR
jgi:hypothetical protein